jgi:hypothetical protein
MILYRRRINPHPQDENTACLIPAFVNPIPTDETRYPRETSGHHSCFAHALPGGKLAHRDSAGDAGCAVGLRSPTALDSVTQHGVPLKSCITCLLNSHKRQISSLRRHLSSGHFHTSDSLIELYKPKINLFKILTTRCTGL